jgi:hypothetical protein
MDKADLRSPPATQTGLPTRDASEITADARYVVKCLWSSDITASTIHLARIGSSFHNF